MTDGRSLPDGRALPPNEEAAIQRERDPNQRRAVRFGALLGGLALGLLLVSWFVRSRAVSLAVFGSGSLAAFALFQLATGESRRAHRERPHTAGRIVESRQGTAHVLFLLPGLSLEPWRADAWVLWVYSGMSAWAGNSWIGRAAGFVQVVLVGLLALRVVASARARFRIELEPGRWLVEAVVAGRSLQRTGRGALMPEL
ncbi:MAG TPA: hypothetical protein VFQ61_33910, partial [Polyangiaceae bacterium]|nr:hypothetical protein [Polyangiaceae bacterium]